MPGVGKGTQATRLCQRLAVPHVSTGNILRDAVQAQSDLGSRVKGSLDSGGLVPDDLMGELIVERLGCGDAGEGFVLDGFPRTEAQVGILDGVLERLRLTLDGVFLLEASEDEVVRRLSGRRVCPKCQKVYHVENNRPAAPGVCDACSSELVQRPDDREEVIRQRLQVYRDQTAPVADRYRERDLLTSIDASGTPDTVWNLLSAAVERR